MRKALCAIHSALSGCSPMLGTPAVVCVTPQCIGVGLNALDMQGSTVRMLLQTVLLGSLVKPVKVQVDPGLATPASLPLLLSTSRRSPEQRGHASAM
jgi:hypothetical protein